MWYLILALLFGQGGVPSQQCNPNGQTSVRSAGDHGGETSTPRPPRPPQK